MKKPFDLGGMIDTTTTPTDTGIPQRGAIPRKPRIEIERRSDQMSIRMTPSTRARIQALADAEGATIAEILERAIQAYQS